MRKSLNAMDVARVIHAHEPIRVARVARIMQEPFHRVRYAVEWLVQSGYVTADAHRYLAVVKVGTHEVSK